MAEKKEEVKKEGKGKEEEKREGKAEKEVLVVEEVSQWSLQAQSNNFICKARHREWHLTCYYFPEKINDKLSIIFA